MPYRVLAIGTFDAVHLGHQKLLRTLVREARARRLEPMVALFPYSPRLFFKGAKAVVKLITTPDERRELIQKHFGIRKIILLPMRKDFFNQPADEFLAREACGKWRARLLIAGENFGLGKDRIFNADSIPILAKPLGLSVRMVPLVRRLAPVSSTRIRGALAEGDMALAGRLMGRPYQIQGRVVRGAGVASAGLGFPTANFQVDARKILPLGVFRARIPELGKWAAVNIGFRPTLRKDAETGRRGEGEMKSERLRAQGGAVAPCVEAHVLGFRGNLYGRHLTLEIYEKLRGEKKFKSMKDLKRQIHQDIRGLEARGFI